MRGPFVNAIPRTGIPRFRETSTLISTRDSEVVARQHFKLSDHSYNMEALCQAVSQIQSQFNRLRVRHGGGSSGSGALNFVGEFDPTRQYSSGQIAIISLGSNAGTYAYINSSPSTGNLPYAGGGFWVQFPIGPSSGVWM